MRAHESSRNFLDSRSRGKAGYKAGEKIAIKANLNNTKDHGTIERLNSSPHMILSLVRQLTGPGRVPESVTSITGDSGQNPSNDDTAATPKRPGGSPSATALEAVAK